MNTDYEKLCYELFGTTDVEKLKEIAQTSKIHNSRNAGRKKQFGDCDIALMRQMQLDGHNQSEIADKFHTTRQTVARYLNADNDLQYTMKIEYMFKRSVCTVIYVNFTERRIRIENRTDDILHRAFGTNENPSWDDFMIFLQDRCFSKTRGDVKSVLSALRLDSYDPLQIVEKTRGRTYEDKLWMRFSYRQSDEAGRI